MNNRVGDCIDRGVSHDPCGPCSVRGLSWIYLGAIREGRGSDWDELGFAGWSNRTLPCRAAWIRQPGRLPQGERIHEGMT